MIIIKTLLYIIIQTAICVSGASAAIIYNSDVDLDDGFYSVTIRESPTASYYPNYTNNVLTINVSDTVTWENTHNKDLTTRVTIVSSQSLWDEKDSYLKWNTRTFSYRFEIPGVYNVHVKENDRFRQTIVVNPTYDSFGNIEIPEPNNAPVQEITDLDPPLKPTPYVFNSHRYVYYERDTAYSYVTIIFLLSLGILHILKKFKIIRKN